MGQGMADKSVLIQVYLYKVVDVWVSLDHVNQITNEDCIFMVYKPFQVYKSYMHVYAEAWPQSSRKA
jgi:hypothetical protein